MPTDPRTATAKNAAGGSAVLTMPSETEIVITRKSNAPRALVFEAMTRPEHVKRWWGLRSTMITEDEVAEDLARLARACKRADGA